jgi:trehalose 6-phosphate synthase
MSRLVVVSNRLPVAARAAEPPAGGLVNVIADAFARRRGGGLWVGWDDHAGRPGRLRRSRRDGVELVGLGLSREEVEGHYLGFCNRALWPILHGFPSRAHFALADRDSSLRAQRRFARVLLKALAPSDLVWIHDYHLLRLPRLLREGGFRGRIGFFLHTPFPATDLWSLLPDAEAMLVDLAAADLIGLQSRRDLVNLRDALRRLAGARGAGSRMRLGARSLRLAVVPAGIEPRDFEPGPEAAARPRASGYLSQLVGGRRTVLGVDRLDYSKGLIERFLAFERFLRNRPEWRRKVCLVQIASPSREGLEWYRRERRELELAAGRINGELGDVDWTPILYLRRTFPRATLARLYRGADVGLVTPLRDGMNLVAKEYVAAQRPHDPGVLVLSRFAGASDSLTAALQVNPWIVEETAEALARGMSMPLAERRRRHRLLLAAVRRDTASAWYDRFLSLLAAR